MENPRKPLLPPTHPLYFHPAYKQEEGKLPVIDFANTKWVLPEVLILGDDGKTDVGDFEVKSDDLAIIEAKKAAKLVEEEEVHGFDGGEVWKDALKRYLRVEKSYFRSKLLKWDFYAEMIRFRNIIPEVVPPHGDDTLQGLISSRWLLG